MTDEEIHARIIVLDKMVSGILIELRELQLQLREGIPPDPRVAQKYLVPAE